MISIARNLETKLKRKSELESNNTKHHKLIDLGVLQKITYKEIKVWAGPMNYISHHGVLKPGPTTTKLRVVNNSSLNNNKSGLSDNDCLHKGPNSPVPLLQLTVAWCYYPHCCVWELSKAYNVVHTTEQELHLHRWVIPQTSSAPSSVCEQIFYALLKWSIGYSSQSQK